MTPTPPGPGHPPGTLREVPVAAIAPNPHQPRRHFAPEQIRELADSIAAQGVIQPLVVRPRPQAAATGDDTAYELVAGERRLRAVRLLGWQAVPVLVREIPDEALLEAALVENLQREALTPLEEATAYRTLLNQYGYTQATLSGRVGKDRSTIANMMRLLALPLPVQHDLEAGRLTIGHARALLGVEDADRQVALRNLVLERGLSVRETERVVHRERERAPVRRAEPSPAPAGSEDLQFAAVQENLERRFATRVGIQRDAGRGRIEIEFYSIDDFNRIYELLMTR